MSFIFLTHIPCLTQPLRENWVTSCKALGISQLYYSPCVQMGADLLITQPRDFFASVLRVIVQIHSKFHLPVIS